MAETLVLLHGFSGTRRAWDEVSAHLDPERYRALALDLPGHGDAADAPRPITFDGCVDWVLERAPERFALCGYSMGARIALHVALRAPERISRLVLIAGSVGIDDERERAQRAAADRALADELERIPFEEFIERWRTQPLFAQDPPAVREMAREDQRRNRPDALAAVLRGIGAGEMQPLGGRLLELRMPLDYIAGERDEKFCAVGRRVAAAVPGSRLTIVRGGHGLPIESPAEVAAVLERIDA